MDNIVDLIATDASASEVTDKIKDMLYAKSAERIEALKPSIANTMFASNDDSVDSEEQTEQEQEE
tara:strand:- start:359 stop:553 length:195 start_codon:yes stop_codon:yes gene_type:complete